MFESLTLLLCLAAIFSFINERFLKLEMTIGLMLLAFIFSISLTLEAIFSNGFFHHQFLNFVKTVDFSAVVLQGFLCFILFAGAKNISLRELNKEKWDVFILSTLATLISIGIIGSLVYLCLQFAGIPIQYIHALIFGAIISPTDPIAALAILSNTGLPKSIEVMIDGESEFNDGIGVVIFVSLLSIAAGESSPTLGHITWLFTQSVIGGIMMGLCISVITHFLIVNAKSTITQVLITLSAVSSGYVLSEILSVSGPIASVVLGLLVGNKTLHQIHSTLTKEHINFFWDIITQVLNAILFVLIGLLALQVNISSFAIVMGMLIAILISFLGRFISVYLSMSVLRFEHKFQLSSLFEISALLTWAGLRGALAIALVLSLPEQPYKYLFMPMVYAVVVVSILLQGSTINRIFPPNKLQSLVKK